MPKETRRKRAADPEDEGAVEKSSTTGKGWGGLANKKKQQELAKEANNGPKDFWLADGETALIQILSPEPVCIDTHSIKNSSGKWETQPCQKLTQRHCLMCREGIKTGWRACFKVIDYRGTWDKDKSRFKNDIKVEKVWMVGTVIAEQLKKLESKCGGDLTKGVFEVERVGAGKNTTYTVAIARDEDDVKLKPVVFKEEFPPIEDLITPLTDAELEAIGFTEE